MSLALHVVPPQFTATMVVGPTGRSGPVSMGPRTPALTPAAGRSIAEQGTADELVSDFSRYLALLTSVPVAEKLEGDPEIMREIFRTSWDVEAGQWRPPTGLASRLGQALRWLAGHQTWAPPDAADLSRHLKRQLSIESVSGGPLRRLVYRHEKRDFAIVLLTRLHGATEAHLREEAARRVKAEMDHVGRRLESLSNMENSRALSALMGEQERLLLMLDVGLPYAADALEAPSALSLADWPNPILLVPAGAVGGLFLALFGIGAYHGWRRG
ncbi:hypothetical protein GE253_01580 [Niveispirillum sp. SYP-B3756]|uniref:hypothetical protein n=1 Tax=Niveispirillum sp. SYP-B3756 TaxID=2662178 RepID=UPI001290CA2D|nr:hypothetical protein [Niveispirillum sp. SYP-B3756]MQP64025.1 hypothetical protein [Niveispirillum sp. SYP-B3756]